MPIQITKTFYAPTRIYWRKWLEQNGHTKKEIWLYLYKKGTTTPSVTYEEVVEEAICYGWIDGVMKGVDSERYAQRFTPRLPKSNWTEANKERYKKLLAKGHITPAGQRAFEQKS